jgi:hypothetical protein
MPFFRNLLEDHAVLREQLVAAKGPEGAALIPSLTLPFDRRFGETRIRSEGRGHHFFATI